MSLPVVRRFVKKVEEAALGERVVKGLSPDQKLVKVWCPLNTRPRLPRHCYHPPGPLRSSSFPWPSQPLRGRGDVPPWFPPQLLPQVVYEELQSLMGGQQAELVEPKYGPAVILMAGLQVRATAREQRGVGGKGRGKGRSGRWRRLHFVMPAARVTAHLGLAGLPA